MKQWFNNHKSIIFSGIAFGITWVSSHSQYVWDKLTTTLPPTAAHWAIIILQGLLLINAIYHNPDLTKAAVAWRPQDQKENT